MKEKPFDVGPFGEDLMIFMNAKYCIGTMKLTREEARILRKKLKKALK